MRVHHYLRGAAWTVLLAPFAVIGAPVAIAGMGFGRLIEWWVGVLADLREARNA